MARAKTSPSYLYQREIQPVEPVSLRHSDVEEQQENSGKGDEEEDGILEYDSPSDDDDIKSYKIRGERIQTSEEVFASTAELC